MTNVEQFIRPMTEESCGDMCNRKFEWIYHLKNADRCSKADDKWHDWWFRTMSGKIVSREYIQGHQNYLKSKTRGQNPMDWIPIIVNSGCLEMLKVMWSYGPQDISTLKVVPWHNPSFLRILTVVRWSMLERAIIITDLQKVCKTLGMGGGSKKLPRRVSRLLNLYRMVKPPCYVLSPLY